MFASQFFRRLFIPYLLLICSATAVIGFFAADRINRAYVESTRMSLSREAAVAVATLQKDLATGGAALQARIRETGNLAGCRISILSADGTNLADTEANADPHETPATSPELVDANETGEGHAVRYTTATQPGTFFFARQTRGSDGKTYFVRLAVRLTELSFELNLLYAALLGIAVTSMALTAALCYFFASRHTAPVRELASFAQALARGERSRRLARAGDGEIGTLTTSLNTMADSLSELLAQLEKERNELLAIVASMNEGVIATDTRQRIVLCNEKAAELLDFPLESVQGKALWEVVQNEPILRATNEVLDGGERKVFQVSVRAGRYLDVAVCTFLTGGKFAGVVLVTHDTTKSVRYQELRKEFVANVSHELRTPLTVISGFTETLRDGAISDPVAGPKFVATIEKHVRQLTNLVSDLLELSKLESMPDLPRRVSVDLSAVTRRVIDLLQDAAQKKKQTLNVELPTQCPRTIGNPDYLERAISNLIENAIKYTPENGVISVSITYNHEFVTIEVQDNGIGIPEADLDRIFERFYRVDRSRSREMGGTGLGLSIVKHVAQVHGGTVDVSSTIGVGSKFMLRIPLPEQE